MLSFEVMYISSEQLLDYFISSSGACTDTRNLKKGSIFFALKGANFDGNQYAEMALENGCAYAVVDDVLLEGKRNILLVENVLKSLQNLARDYRRTFDLPVLGITGSNGKTTTKELLYEVISQKYNTLATFGNLNNHIGVPLTLLNLNQSHEFAIIEMGANKPGDIKELCGIAEPNFTLITNVGKAHLEGFGDFEGVKRTKGELYDFALKNGHPIFINIDNSNLLEMAARNDQRITYSITSDESDVQGTLQGNSLCIRFTWKSNDYQSDLIHTNLTGSYNLENMLAAVSVGRHFGVTNDSICKALENYVPSNNRSQIQKTDKNTLILDAYNANPTSTKAALENLNLVKHGCKTFILGDMLELGEESISAHKEIIELANEFKIRGYFVGREFMQAGAPNSFKTAEELNDHLKLEIIENQMILIKGSRGVKLESVVEFL